MNDKKKLYRSNTQKVLAGVCGGIAEYFNIDPTIVRLVWFIVSFFIFGFPGLVVYVACALIIPKEPEQKDIFDAEYREKEESVNVETK